ncbi:hypothetical protein HB852_09235 [Listeria grandensis]|nr:hypothetical protein [Listeria grandensis]
MIITRSRAPIEGLATPQAEVIISDTKGNTTSSLADTTGKFSVDYPDSFVENGSTLTIQQKINGLTGPAHTFRIGWEVDILACTATEMVVAGKANTDTQIRLKNGSILSQGKTDDLGRHTANISHVPVGSELTIIQMYGGLELHKTYTLPPVPPKFTVTESTLTEIKGIGLPRGLISLHPDRSSFLIHPDGTFFIDYRIYWEPWEPPTLGSKLYFYQEYAGRSGPVQEVLVGWSQRVALMTEASSSLTGTGSPNTPTRVQTESGQILGHGASGSNGQFAIHIAKQKAGTKLQVI